MNILGFLKSWHKVFENAHKEQSGADDPKEIARYRLQRRMEAYLQKKQTGIRQNAVLCHQLEGDYHDINHGIGQWKQDICSRISPRGKLLSLENFFFPVESNSPALFVNYQNFRENADSQKAVGAELHGILMDIGKELGTGRMGRLDGACMRVYIRRHHVSQALLHLLHDLAKMNGVALAEGKYKVTHEPGSITAELVKIMGLEEALREEMTRLEVDMKDQRSYHEQIISLMRRFGKEHPLFEQVLQNFPEEKRQLDLLVHEQADMSGLIASVKEKCLVLSHILNDAENIILEESGYIAKEEKAINDAEERKVKDNASAKGECFERERKSLLDAIEQELFIEHIVATDYFGKEMHDLEEQEKLYKKKFMKRLGDVGRNFIRDWIIAPGSLRKIRFENYTKYPMPKMEALSMLRQQFGESEAFLSLELNELSCETNQFVLIIERRDGKDMDVHEQRDLFRKIGYNTKVILEDHRGEDMSGARNINGYYLRGESLMRALTGNAAARWVSGMLYGYEDHYSNMFLSRMAPGEDRRHVKFWKFGTMWAGTVHDDIGFMPIPHKARRFFPFTKPSEERTVAERLKAHNLKLNTPDYISGGQYATGLWEFYTKELAKVAIKPGMQWREDKYREMFHL